LKLFCSAVTARLAILSRHVAARILYLSDFPVLKGDAMNDSKCHGTCVAGWWLLVLLMWFMPATLVAEPLPLKRAVELALAHSTTTAIAAADEQRAYAAYRELRNNYLPQAAVGSGLGKSWGFPLSLEGAAPSLVNFTASSALYNPSLHEAMRAAKVDSQATTTQSKDQRNQVIQDTVLSYASLSKWERRIGRLQDEQAAAMKLEEALAERVKEGVDSPLERTKARLSAARLRLRLTEAEGSADVLRQHLGKLTGLPAASIETIADSVPSFPALNQEEDLSATAENNPAVESAVQHARAQYLRAKAEHKALLPTFDFATQYARLTRYNNYDVFFAAYEPNNASIGVVIRFPFLNFAQRARAQAADAEALKAKKQAEATKNQVSEETLKLQRMVRQMEAAQEVAQLEYEVAESNLDALQTRVDAGTASIRDLGEARAQANERYIALQDTKFELQQARIGLMRSTGDLESWINGGN
jgi:outer membrane protein TolC